MSQEGQATLFQACTGLPFKVPGELNPNSSQGLGEPGDRGLNRQDEVCWGGGGRGPPWAESSLGERRRQGSCGWGRASGRGEGQGAPGGGHRVGLWGASSRKGLSVEQMLPRSLRTLGVLRGPSPGPQKLSRRCCPPGVTQPSTSQHLQQTCSRVPRAPPCGGAPVPSPGLPTQRRSRHPHPAALELSRDCMQDTDGPHWQGWGGGQETPRAGNAGGSKAACGEGPGGATPTPAPSQGALQKPKASPASSRVKGSSPRTGQPGWGGDQGPGAACLVTADGGDVGLR